MLESGVHNSILRPPIPNLHSPISILCRQRGSNIVELALTLPVLLWILIGILDMGRAVFAQNMISNAAREGARYGSVDPSDTAGITQRVNDTALGLDPANLAVGVDATLVTVTVTVTYTFTPVTPMIGDAIGAGGTLTINARSTMNLESAP